ncbi:uncharacterized protein LOC106869328 isoform X3 [Octopus bimaculoides]|uniref:uncharacterized protein LOC106869328 isoform X3 n=1 Tax=Octopus bimaculoides TaxID=37653 RepID=UPI00071C798B|nr:uncharacterized protein LOC106869328 isoform X3 [Octopus bimaculoides]|eukprot:XP_014770523.1 PREDICTED: uncharacterized protein LOC106869328 isoform X4 [Octopus bimaculoides]
MENYPEYYYYYEYNSTFTEPSSSIWVNLSACVATIVIFLFSALLTTAIFLDRGAYGKTRSFLLLNYMFNYTLFALFFYFHNVHIHIFTDLPQSTCLFIIILTSVTNDAALYFILPICCDFIVKYFKPSKYESHSFLRTQIIFTVVLWVFIWIKELLMILAFSDYGVDQCYIFLHFISLCIHLAIESLYIVTMLVLVCLLIYIAVKSRENDTMKLSLITMIVIVIFVITLYSAETIVFVGLYGIIQITILYVPLLLNLIRFVIVPFLLLFDVTIRQSIRKLYSGKCKKPIRPPSHELTTELN